MPKNVENKLRKEAIARRLKGKSADSYVYGTMNKKGLMHGNKTTKPDSESTEKKPDSEKAEGESPLMAAAKAHMKGN